MRLAVQDEEKDKWVAELIVTNKDLVAQLLVANKKLELQHEENEKRTSELTVANEALLFQNQEKEKRAAELTIANQDLLFQNEEKEKRAIGLSNANRELGQFAYIASHDLQEPLRTVSNYIQVFEEDYGALFDDNAHKYCDAIKKAIKRMSDLIRSLLDFSRLGYNTTLTHVHIKEVIDEVIADLDIMIKNSHATIEVGEMPRLNIYEIELRQVFQNLIVNAIKFRKNDSEPHIQISADNSSGIWKFTVHDNGIGIDSSHFDRIFDIFQRLAITEKYEGSGIGLANCKKIVHFHQGKIWVESTVEQGTSFHFTISDLIS